MLRRCSRLLLVLLTATIALTVLNLNAELFFGFERSSGQQRTDLGSDSDGNEMRQPLYRKKDVQLHTATLFFGAAVNNNYLAKCSVKDHCKLVEERSAADAIIYHAPDFVSMGRLKANQIAVLWSLESPINHFFHHNYAGRINWTMTYRRDSDVWFPYGVITKRHQPVLVDYEAIWASKKHVVICLMSNCRHNNGRIQLINAIQAAGITVDMFGACGYRKTPNDCDGVKKQGDRCVAQLFRQYKFAISFENSLCKDYVTEKFFDVLRNRFTVPIVMRRKTSEEIGAPPDSFIAVDDYKNVSDLVNDLHRIAKSKTAYMKYHLWRETFEVNSDYFAIENTGFCELCKKIMRQDFRPKHYDDVASWQTRGVCDHPQDGFVNEFLGYPRNRFSTRTPQRSINIR
uniref:Fucosyltransferase n=1 Tax=Parascaris univalens TaxID=6257 RepID=A0A915CGL9_PARUN